MAEYCFPCSFKVIIKSIILRSICLASLHNNMSSSSPKYSMNFLKRRVYAFLVSFDLIELENRRYDCSCYMHRVNLIILLNKSSICSTSIIFSANLSTRTLIVFIVHYCWAQLFLETMSLFFLSLP